MNIMHALYMCLCLRLDSHYLDSMDYIQIQIANNTSGNMIAGNQNQNSNSPQAVMVNHMSGSMSTLYAFASTSKLKTLVYNPNEETTIIKDKYQLESDVVYSFENLKLLKGALLTVAEYNSETNQNGGILRIKCTHLTLEDGITVNGKDINVVKVCGIKVKVIYIKEYRNNNYGWR